jgi:hypothetical protein
MKTGRVIPAVLALLLVAGSGQAADSLFREVREIKAAMPKFGIPMREVGERFQNMYAAARAENWGLANYMARSMNAAMNPVKVSEEYLYPFWEQFYGSYFKPVSSAITAQDLKAFEKEGALVVEKCNYCHYVMAFQFVRVKVPTTPASQLLDFTVKSKAADFRE